MNWSFVLFYKERTHGADRRHDIMSTAHENRSAIALCVHHQSFGLVIYGII